MHPYNFSRAEIRQITEGSLAFTLARVGSFRHVRLGERFHFNLVEGALGQANVASALCVYRARAVLTEQGLLRVVNAHALEEGEPTARLFSAAEQGSSQAGRHADILAQQLGFAAWTNLFALHEAQQGGGSRKTLLREVVGWAHVQTVRKVK